MILTIEKHVADEGSIQVFEGVDLTGRRFVFGADHRPGAAIVEALEAGEEVTAEVETWSILGYSPSVQTVEDRLAAAQADREGMTT